MSSIGTISIGVRTPILREKDDLISAVVTSVINASKESELPLKDGDIIGITESLLARTQGNYITTDDITKEVRKKFGGSIGLIFPILSRNRFCSVLKGIAAGVDKLTIQLSFPFDEVGNPIVTEEQLMDNGISNDQVFTLEEFRKIFPDTKHKFTGVDYLDLYKDIAPNVEIILANDPRAILNFQKDVLIASIHRRKRDKKLLLEAGADKVYDLSEILNEATNEHGYNPEHGLLGCNFADGCRIKLFPRDGQKVVEAVQKDIYDKTKAKVEVLIFGDGAFKDPVCGIWELADPVVSPYYTSGLVGTPNELKLKAIADSSDATESEIIEKIKNNTASTGALGTTPRQITDLVGSLCDLTSGSGDKGTPVIWIKGYNRKLCDDSNIKS